MPFIDSKVTVKMSDEQKETLKSSLGQAITTMNKTPKACDAMTGKICDIFADVLGIPGNAVYVTYHGVHDWGWNGGNF